MSGKRGELLVIVYYFPPWGGGPVFRTLKFTKYLERLGWRIRVLTVRPEYYEPVAYDSSLLAEVSPAIRVCRTRSLLPVGSLSRALTQEALGRSTGARSLAARLMPIARVVHSALIPDDKLLWLPYALWRGLLLCREKVPDIVYVSAPPHSSTLVALLLSWLVRRPLVVDFRDDWIGNPLFRRSSRVRHSLEACLEAAVVNGARKIIVPTLPSKQRLARRYPSRAQAIQVVPNGFDDEDVDAVSAHNSFDSDKTQLTCVYTGLLNQRRDLTGLLRAIQRLESRSAGTVRLYLAGYIPDATARTISELGLVDAVRILGYVPHADVVALIKSADVAVLVSTAAEGSDTAVPSKLYEYVACAAVVLALVDRGATADLVEANGWGLACRPDDESAIVAALEEFLRRKTGAEPLLDPESRARVAAFSRRRQAEALDEMLTDVVQAPMRDSA